MGAGKAKSPAAAPTHKSVACQTGEFWEHVNLFETKLTIPVERSLSDENQGDPDRGILGTGTIIVKRSTKGDEETKFTCQMFSDELKLKFQAFFPDAEDANKVMWINLEKKNSLIWDAVDTSADPMLRRFTICFDDGPQMFSFLLYGFVGNYNLVNEFLTPGSHFFLRGGLVLHIQ